MPNVCLARLCLVMPACLIRFAAVNLSRLDIPHSVDDAISSDTSFPNIGAAKKFKGYLLFLMSIPEALDTLHCLVRIRANIFNYYGVIVVLLCNGPPCFPGVFGTLHSGGYSRGLDLPK
jgi:hypothetical protein